MRENNISIYGIFYKPALSFINLNMTWLRLVRFENTRGFWGLYPPWHSTPQTSPAEGSVYKGSTTCPTPHVKKPSVSQAPEEESKCNQRKSFIQSAPAPAIRDPILKETGKLSVITKIVRHIKYHGDFQKNIQQPWRYTPLLIILAVEYSSYSSRHDILNGSQFASLF